MPLLGGFVDWVREFPEGDLGLWLVFIAVVGTFVLALGIGPWKRRASYIEFHDNWTAKHDPGSGTVTVSGRVTVVSPAASIMATCKAKFGKISTPLRFTSSDRHLLIPNATVLTFVGQGLPIPEGSSEVVIDVRIKLGDGSKKRMKRTLSIG